jgi:hypothetical protein
LTEQRRLLAPIVAIVIVVTLGSVYTATLMFYNGEASKHALLLYNIAFSFVVACGVEADRRGRSVGSSYEYAAYVFFLWPVVLPIYLFQTRRWRGLAVALGVIMLSEVPSFVALIAYFWLVSSGT